MPSAKNEDNAKKHVLAKIRTEMTDTIVKDSADLAAELMMNASFRTFSDKRIEGTLQLVTRKLPHIVDKHSVLTQETEKRQKQFQQLRVELSNIRQTINTNREELAKVRSRFVAADKLLSEVKTYADSMSCDLRTLAGRKISEAKPLGDLCNALFPQLGFRLEPHPEGVKISLQNGRHYIFTGASVVDASTMQPLELSFDTDTFGQISMSDLYSIVKKIQIHDSKKSHNAI